MTCGAGDFGQGADVMSSVGLVGSHAYSLISAFVVQDARGHDVKLLKLRNPWGQKEWTGDWSDDSSKWTPELKEKVNLENKDDGIFYMQWEDFVKYFTDVQICEFYDTYVYNSHQMESGAKNAKYFKLTVKEAGRYYITANQTSKRKFLPEQKYQYSEISLIIAGKDADGNLVHIDGFQRADKEVWTHGDLIEGEYYVYCKTNWRDGLNHKFSVGVYGPAEAQIEQVEKTAEMKSYIQQCYLTLGRKSQKLIDYGYYGVKECWRALELTDDGIGFLYYKNESDKTLDEELQFTLQGWKFMKPYRGENIQVKVPPHEEKVIILK